MKKYSQIHKVISVLMIFILLIQFSSCYTYRKITVSDLPKPVDYHYIMHYKNNNFLLVDVEISNEVMTGEIDAAYLNESTSLKGNKVHLFLSLGEESDTGFCKLNAIKMRTTHKALPDYFFQLSTNEDNTEAKLPQCGLKIEKNGEDVTPGKGTYKVKCLDDKMFIKSSGDIEDILLKDWLQIKDVD